MNQGQIIIDQTIPHNGPCSLARGRNRINKPHILGTSDLFLPRKLLADQKIQHRKTNLYVPFHAFGIKTNRTYAEITKIAEPYLVGKASRVLLILRTAKFRLAPIESYGSWKAAIEAKITRYGIMKLLLFHLGVAAVDFQNSADGTWPPPHNELAEKLFPSLLRRRPC